MNCQILLMFPSLAKRKLNLLASSIEKSKIACAKFCRTLSSIGLKSCHPETWIFFFVVLVDKGWKISFNVRFLCCCQLFVLLLLSQNSIQRRTLIVVVSEPPLKLLLEFLIPLLKAGYDMRKHTIYVWKKLPLSHCTNYPPPVDNHSLGILKNLCHD